MIGFIGFGRMGGALARGAYNSNVLKPSQIVGFDHNPKAQQALKKMGAKAARSVVDVVRQADIIFLCVKPQSMRDALTPIALDRANLKMDKKCFVSIAAGITIKSLQKWLGDKTAVFRVMPNTPALLGAGMSAVAKGRTATKAQESKVKKILSSVGAVEIVPEGLMDAVTAVSGSGPAYVFYLAEAMIEAAKKLGMNGNLARKLVHQTVYGAGEMLGASTEPAEVLRRHVTSPGGTTAAAMGVFDQQNFKHIVQAALRSAARRSAQLAKS